ALAPAFSDEASASEKTSPAEAKKIAKKAMKKRGWGTRQYRCLVPLWQAESKWSTTAGYIRGSYGIPQAYPGSKMASAGKDWRTNAATQIAWGLGYIAGRYGTPCAAWRHFQRYRWY
ncbi:MAG: hypothetical protein LBU05_00170, partial [Bifidobacteriaceae bacterium]|nr:hypothetical protein [Bifidobacteriaceae bacterium]